MQIFREVEENELIVWVSILVMAEVVWLMEKHFDYKRERFISKLIKVVSLPSVRVLEIPKGDLVRILNVFGQKKVDFTDIYIVLIAAGRKVESFDKDIGKLTRLLKK